MYFNIHVPQYNYTETYEKSADCTYYNENILLNFYMCLYYFI